MFRVTNSFKNLRITKEVINPDSYFLNFQTVRWRKPRWIPIAKSKIFKVVPRTVIPEDEEIELKRLNDNYKTQVRSIRKYLINKYYEFGLSQTDPEEHKRIFEEDYAHCAALNSKWNEEQKVLREKRVAEELEAELNLARKRLEDELLKQEEKYQFIEALVRKEKEQSKTFITPENIDAAIELAFANPADYNYAVNLNGEKIIGFEKENVEEKSKIGLTH